MTVVFSNKRVNFKLIFAAAQDQLRTVFGMQMVELPLREKVTVKERRGSCVLTPRGINP